MDLFNLAPITEWLQIHKDWLLAAIFIAALIESLAIIGMIIPGVAILFGLAGIAGSSEIHLLHVLIAGALGAITGDCLSFFLGFHYKDRILKLYPFNRYPMAITKGNEFFKKHGIVSVVIGRFIGPMRAVIPLAAGSLGMPPKQFVSINLLSALAWAPVYLLPGYLVGKSMEELNAGYADLTKVFVLLLGLIWLSAMVMMWLKQRHTEEKSTRPNLVLSKVQQLCVLGFLLTFLTLAFAVPESQLNSSNRFVTDYLQSARIASLDPVIIFFTGVGTTKPIALFTICFIAFLLHQKQLATALSFSIMMVFSPVLIFGLKALFNFPRPDIVFSLPKGAAFPSGHATITTMTIGFIGYLLLQHQAAKAHFRTLAAISSFIIVMGFSRLYLGVHWLTDVMAGISLGIITLTLTFGLKVQLTAFLSSKDATKALADNQPVSAVKIAGAATASIAAAYLFLVVPNFDKKLEAYEIKPRASQQLEQLSD